MAITAASVEANGWVLRLTLSATLGSFANYVLDPGGTPRVALTSSHTGYIKSGGQAVSGNIARNFIGTKPLRLPVNPASPTTAVIDETDLGGGSIRVRIALTEHVYASDTALSLTVLAGWRMGESAGSGIAVTNNSTVVAPVPIMRWALLPYGTTAGVFTVALFVASHHPLGFEPVAGVKFTATDGSNIKTVWTTQLSTDTSYGDGLRCYTASIDPATATALTAGLLRCDAEIYPWLGAMRSTDTAGTRSMANARTDGFAVDAASPWIIGFDPAGTRYGSQFAFVDPINGTITAAAGMVAATLAGAKAVAAASRPKDINTAIQAGYLANRTLAIANGQAASSRSIDGMQIVLAAGTHAVGSTAVTSGLTSAEIPLRIIGDPADSNPRANCILPTGANVIPRATRVMFQDMTAEIGVNAYCGAYVLMDSVTVRGRSGSESSTSAAFSSAPAAGLWNLGMARTRWWRTASAIGAGNTRAGPVRACETSRGINSCLIAVKNRLIPSAEDGFVGTTVFPAYSGWGSPTLAGQAEDIIIAFNDIRSLRGRAVAFAVLPAATAGTPNPSTRRQVFLGNVCERIGADLSPFYGIGEDASATMSYNIIEANSFIGDRSNTFYSDPLPTTIAETNSQLNQAFVNRVANNVFDWLPTKQDDFSDPQSATLRGTAGGYRPQMIEAWSMLYGVGHEANVDTRRTGTTLFPLEYSGPRSVAGYAGAIAPLYGDDRSILGLAGAAALGGGNYRPASVSPLAARAVRGNGDVDGDGLIRRVPFTVGAFQAAAVDMAPASVRSAMRAEGAVVAWGGALHPAGARHLQRAGALRLEPMVLPGSGLVVVRGGVALVGWATGVVPVSARLAQATGATRLGLAMALLPANDWLPFGSTAPAVALDTLLTLSPDGGRVALRSGVPLLFTGNGAPNAVLIIGADPRILFPQRN